MINKELTEHGRPCLIDHIEANRATPSTKLVSVDEGAYKLHAYSSSILGWKILFMKPILGDL
jgi:hypothetical protein